MASSATYWLCRCGKAHPLAERACAACGKKPPISKRLVVSGVLGILAVASLIVFGAPPASIEYPADQKAFLAVVKDYQARWNAAPNPVTRKEALAERDQTLGQRRTIEGWTGTILGVNPMSNGIGLALDIGGPHLLAGEYVTRFINTTITRSDRELVAVVEHLKPGTRVIFSGQLEVDAGRLVEISYTEQASATAPRYLIRFTTMKPIQR